MKYSILVALFCSLVLTTNAQKADKRLAGLDSMIQRMLTEWKVPGVSVTVVEKNKVLLAKGFGYKDYERKAPVTENTQFAIGSCTKAFTASLVGFALKEKGIDLDLPVHSYFPALQFLDPTLTANVTLRDMLCHRTGLPRHDYSWYSGAAIARDSLVHNIRFLEASAPLRQNFQYNNYMYMAVASVLEKLYGKTWEQLVEEKLFTPLSMKNSSTGSMGTSGDFSYGYVYKNGTIQKVEFLTEAVKGMAPAGGISSTANDMARWLLLWTNQGRWEDKEIISPYFYQQAISSQMIASANLPTSKMTDYYFFNYGLGWYVANYRGHYGVGHGGNVNGFSSFTSFLPTDSIGIFVSVNQNNSVLPRILTNILIDRMIEAGFRDWNAILKQPADNRQQASKTNLPITQPSHPLQQYNGNYTNNGYGNITIQAEQGKLTGTFNRWKLTIQHHQYNYFTFSVNATVFDGSEAIRGEFKVGADGNIEALTLPYEDGIKPIEFKKEIAVVALDMGELKKYEGSFTLSGLLFKTYIDANGVLKAMVPGQPEYEMVPVKEHVFNLKGLTGFSARFIVDDKGNVTGCALTQPNGTFELTKVLTTAPATVSAPTSNTVMGATEAGLSSYTGEYMMGGQTVKIWMDAGKLKALLPGQPPYELVQGKNEAFSIKGVTGYSVVFEKDTKGSVTGYTMYQPNGSVKAEKKK